MEDEARDAEDPRLFWGRHPLLWSLKLVAVVLVIVGTVVVLIR